MALPATFTNVNKTAKQKAVSSAKLIMKKIPEKSNDDVQQSMFHYCSSDKSLTQKQQLVKLRQLMVKKVFVS